MSIEEEREYSDEDYDKVNKETKKIYAKFERSETYEKMPKYCKKHAKDVVWALGEMCYGYELQFPEDWSLDAFLFQTDTIQKKCMFPNSFFKAFPKIIYHFSKFCALNNIGTFNLDEIEEYKKDLKNGIYEDKFYSSWDEGYEARQEMYKFFER